MKNLLEKIEGKSNLKIVRLGKEPGKIRLSRVFVGGRAIRLMIERAMGGASGANGGRVIVKGVTSVGEDTGTERWTELKLTRAN